MPALFLLAIHILLCDNVESRDEAESRDKAAHGAAFFFPAYQMLPVFPASEPLSIFLCVVIYHARGSLCQSSKLSEASIGLKRKKNNFANEMVEKQGLLFY